MKRKWKEKKKEKSDKRTCKQVSTMNPKNQHGVSIEKKKKKIVVDAAKDEFTKHLQQEKKVTPTKKLKNLD